MSYYNNAVIKANLIQTAINYLPDKEAETVIGAQAFYQHSSIAEYHFLPTTPPTLANINAFSNLPSDCKIYVPAASLTAYQEATNWSEYASYMVGE